MGQNKDKVLTSFILVRSTLKGSLNFQARLVDDNNITYTYRQQGLTERKLYFLHVYTFFLHFFTFLHAYTHAFII